LITIGNLNNFNLDIPEIKWTHLGLVNSDKKLNLVYRASDVLVCPSLYCFGPHIVTEALLNDLPVVGFDLGVAQDSIINGINGYLVPLYNNKIFAESILKTLNKRKITNNKKINEIKRYCSSEYEAESIIKKSNSDFQKI
jgi:glycosyltransferase involved in cell wall biosynthesis